MERDYNSWNVQDLKAELKRRRLKVTGKKSELVQRLQDNDKGKSVEKFGVRTPSRISGPKRSLTQTQRVTQPTSPDISYLEFTPRDILRYGLSYIDPKDIRSICAQKDLRSICQNPKILEEYLINRGLSKFLTKVNDGLEWAARIGSPDFINYFIKEVGYNWDRAMAWGGWAWTTARDWVCR